MPHVLVLHAGHELHIELIAERLAAELRAAGLDAKVRDVTKPRPPIPFESLQGAVLMAAVRAGRHGRQIIRFTSANSARLARIPCVFASVGPALGSDDVIAGFIARTGWRPRLASALPPDDPAALAALAEGIVAVLRSDSPPTAAHHR